MEIDDVMQTLQSSVQGLDEEEAKCRLEEFGLNELRKEKRITTIGIFINQFKSILILILIFSALVSGVILKEKTDMFVILIIVFMNAILGFVQEFRAEKAVEALKKMIAPQALVKRGNIEKMIPSKELVPGDIILLDAGFRVPADARVIDTVSLTLDEAPLTGESTPLLKKTKVLNVDTPLADRLNLIFMGTSVTYGRGKGIVVNTGMKTIFGKIAEMVQSVEVEQPPLKARVERLGRQLGLISLLLCIFVFIVGFFVHQAGIGELFMISVSLAVSAIPEGLPAVITITLAIGVSRMARQRAIVRRLASVETLGCTTVICSDKTGTLTAGEMTVRRIYCNDEMVEVTGVGYEPKGDFLLSIPSLPNNANSGYETKVIIPKNNVELSLLLRIGMLCNNAHLKKNNSTWTILGDPTEGALIVVAAKADMMQEDMESHFMRVGEVPFSSERKQMTTIHSIQGDKRLAYTKGAVEVVLERCTHILEDGVEKELTEARKKEILKINDGMASTALRVLGMAYKRLSNHLVDFTEENVEIDLVFVGLIGMIDPPREEVKEANRLCEQAGIRAVMITGDHKMTALAIAQEIGIHKEGGLVLTGTELDQLGEEEYMKIVEDVDVYARVSPEHKMRIVKALKAKGHIVAMTGDGVNDAPAIKMADVGVAMGIKGTDVTKEASDMVLEDDNFATIVSAVESGRHIYDNIKKYMRLMLTANFDEFFEITVASLLGLPLPLLPIHILWVNLVSDGIPAVALSVDPKDPEIMQRSPRDPQEGILSRIWRFIIFGATLDFISDFIPFLYIYFTTGSAIRARTAAFTSIVLFEFFLAFNCRSERHSIFGLGWKGIFANKLLLISVIASIGLQLAIVYVPFLQVIFKTVALTPFELGLCVALSSLGLLIFPGKLIKQEVRNRKR